MAGSPATLDFGSFSEQYLMNAVQALADHSLNQLTIDPVVAPGGTDTNFKVSAFSYKIGGVTYNKAAADNIAAPGASTTASQFRKVLLSINTSGTITATAGAVSTVSQADAALPDVPSGELAIGYLELPNSFTSGTTSVTAGMCKRYTESIDLTP